MGTYFSEPRSNVAAFLPHKYSRVLEIGCAEGRFRQSLAQRCEYVGVEPSPAAAKIAAERLDKVLAGTFEEVADELPDRYFDLIVCNDVIEHMPDHDAFLQAVKIKLVDGGVIVGSIPNMRYVAALGMLVLARDWRYTHSGVLDRTHLRFFTRKSLSRTFRDNGYVIECIAGINPMWSLGSGVKHALHTMAALPLMIVLGTDTRFLQYAFRVRPHP